jgi:hypothetical protein
MEHTDRTVAKIALITVMITLGMLCLVYVYLVVERVGWGHTVNNVSLLVP